MKLRHIGLASLLTFSLFTATLYSSCSKDPCSNVQCENNGSCSDGNCICPTGYTGPNCEASAFAGTWNGTDVCTSNSYTITVTIAPSSVSTATILVTNPGGFGASVTISGTLSADGTTATFTNQDVGGGRTLNGAMTLSSNLTFVFDYTTVGPLDQDQCEGTYTKQ